MALAKKIFMEMGCKSLHRKHKRVKKRGETMLVAKKGNKKTVRRKGCKSSQRRLKEMLKELNMKVAEKRAEMNSDRELQRDSEANLEQLRSECIQIMRQNRLAIENNEFTQLCIDLILDLLQALDEGDVVKAALLSQSLRELIGYQNGDLGRRR